MGKRRDALSAGRCHSQDPVCISRHNEEKKTESNLVVISL